MYKCNKMFYLIVNITFANMSEIYLTIYKLYNTRILLKCLFNN